jgi:hypothetical protein
MTLTTKILSVDSPNSRGAVNVFSGAPLDFVKVIAACLIGVDRGWIPLRGAGHGVQFLQLMRLRI